MLEIIPVVDILSGIVVQAKAGERKNYRPIESSLCKSKDPIKIISALYNKTNSNVFYIADLDAIEGKRAQTNLINEILQEFPFLTIWLDGGFKKKENVKSLFSQNIQIFSSVKKNINNITPVFGTESISSYSEAKRIFTTIPNSILSIDKKNDIYLDNAKIRFNSKLWPQRIILMSLSSVGLKNGPDLKWLKQMKKTYPDFSFYGAGGINSINDCESVFSSGACGWLCASALHQGII